MILGITGGVGSGKSTLATIFRNMHIPVLDADEIAHHFLNDPEIQAKILAIWGEQAFFGGKIDRKWLAKRIFSSPVEREKLEEILHPPILEVIQQKIQQARQENKDLVVIIPLLFEKNLQHLFDEVWLATAPYAERIRRIQQRDGVSAYSVKKRISVQMHEAKKRSRAHRIISTHQPLNILAQNIQIQWNQTKSHND